MACIVPFKPYTSSGADICTKTPKRPPSNSGIVLAKSTPYPNCEAGEITADGSTYAVGKYSPDARSILSIPSTAMEKRSSILADTSSGR